MWPATLAQLSCRLDEALREELVALQAAAAMTEGLVSPAHLLRDPLPSEHGRQRVPEATTLDKAPPGAHRRHRAAGQPPSHGPHASSPNPPPGAEKSPAVLWPPMPRARARL